MSFKDNLLEKQKELKIIYEREIDKVGGITFWEMATNDEGKGEETEKTK